MTPAAATACCCGCCMPYALRRRRRLLLLLLRHRRPPSLLDGLDLEMGADEGEHKALEVLRGTTSDSSSQRQGQQEGCQQVGVGCGHRHTRGHTQGYGTIR
jgi:hypothetical protein